MTSAAHEPIYCVKVGSVDTFWKVYAAAYILDDIYLSSQDSWNAIDGLLLHFLVSLRELYQNETIAMLILSGKARTAVPNYDISKNKNPGETEEILEKEYSQLPVQNKKGNGLCIRMLILGSEYYYRDDGLYFYLD